MLLKPLLRLLRITGFLCGHNYNSWFRLHLFPASTDSLYCNDRLLQVSLLSGTLSWYFCFQRHHIHRYEGSFRYMLHWSVDLMHHNHRKSFHCLPAVPVSLFSQDLISHNIIIIVITFCKVCSGM